jgi:hypothetical protein
MVVSQPTRKPTKTQVEDYCSLLFIGYTLSWMVVVEVPTLFDRHLVTSLSERIEIFIVYMWLIVCF